MANLSPLMPRLVMSDSRLRIALDDDYANGVGRAAYVFAILEWNVVWCAERLQPGFLATIRGRTAGQIGAAFETIATAIPDDGLRSQVAPLALRYRELVRLRNALLHGKPCTAEDGLQRLSAEGGDVFHLADINSIADQFADCSIELNQLLHGPLRPPEP
jgi:hypothetical protein